MWTDSGPSAAMKGNVFETTSSRIYSWLLHFKLIISLSADARKWPLFSCFWSSCHQIRQQPNSHCLQTQPLSNYFKRGRGGKQELLRAVFFFLTISPVPSEASICHNLWGKQLAAPHALQLHFITLQWKTKTLAPVFHFYRARGWERNSCNLEMESTLILLPTSSSQSFCSERGSGNTELPWHCYFFH